MKKELKISKIWVRILGINGTRTKKCSQKLLIRGAKKGKIENEYQGENL